MIRTDQNVERIFKVCPDCKGEQKILDRITEQHVPITEGSTSGEMAMFMGFGGGSISGHTSTHVEKRENRSWRVCETCRNSERPGHVLDGYSRYIYVTECWHDYREFKIRLSSGEVITVNEWDLIHLAPEERVRHLCEKMIKRASITKEEFDQMKVDGWREIPAAEQIVGFVNQHSGNSLESALMRIAGFK